MRELDCDFCGRGATGAYEVVPAELDPTPDEQVRVVLCGNCRETLDGVLSPLFDRLGVRDPVEPSFASDAAGHSVPAASADGAADDRGSVTADADEDEEAHEDGGTAEDAEPAWSADAAGHERPGADAPDAPPTADAESSDAEPDDDDASTGTSAAGSERGEPEHFRKVMRFLNNREFPVDRAEVSEFAAGAYDLDDEEIDEIFDYAVERGVLVERGGKLTKG